MAKEDKPCVAEENESEKDDECYQVPWEFACSSANLKLKKTKNSQGFNYPSLLSEMKEKQNNCDAKTPPVCGMAARYLLTGKVKEKLTNRSTQNCFGRNQVRLEPSQKVWKYRGPEDDHRSSSEYDVPWDLHKKRNANGDSAAVNEKLRSADNLRNTYKTAGNNFLLRKTKAQSVSVDSPEFFLRRRDFCAKNSASPATSTSSSAGAVSNHSENSVESTSNALKSSSSQGSTDNLKLSGTPLLETAFCVKASIGRVSPEDKRILEAKDRLIQRLCQETEKEFLERKQMTTGKNDLSSKKKPRKPVPAPRKKNQSEGKTNGETGVEDTQMKGPVSFKDTTGATTESVAEEEYDIPWEFCSKNKLDRLVHTNNKQGSDKPADSVCLDRKSLSLNFGCAGLNPVAEKVDKDLPLNQQNWYHGNISRAESELRLAKVQEGSYLIRNCESNREEYALSLKSAKGFMHMKIQLNEEKKWILGYFSQPFPCIPSMVKYYSINKLPIKGAEHMCLLYPVKDTLL